MVGTKVYLTPAIADRVAILTYTPPTAAPTATDGTHNGTYNGNITMGNRVFHVYDEALSWSAARQICLASGKDLASIHSGAENTVIGDFLNGFTHRRRRVRAWIGLTDSVTEGNWTWSDGTSGAYANWAPGEPNGAFGGGEDCAEIDNGQWNDMLDDSASHSAGNPPLYVCAAAAARCEAIGGVQDGSICCLATCGACGGSGNLKLLPPKTWRCVFLHALILSMQGAAPGQAARRDAARGPSPPPTARAPNSPRLASFSVPSLT
jgi:hypothetical protein